MARRATLTREALVALGADRLAKLILDEVQHNAPFKRIITAALAGAKGPDAVAAIIDRRLASLKRAQGIVGWDKRRAFAADLKATLATSVDELGGVDPRAAAERLLRFLASAEGVFERVDDPSGSIARIYQDAAAALPAMALRMANEDRLNLLARLVPLLLSDDYGLIEDVVHGCVNTLPAEELEAFDLALTQALAKIPTSDGARDWERQERSDRLIRARQAIADGRDDVEVFMTLEAQKPERSRDDLAIAERLLRAGRGAEALEWVRRPSRPGLRAMDRQDLADASGGIDVRERRRVGLEILILTDQGDRETAQHLRWATFQATLEVELLREYVAKLPDFEDEEALDGAFAYVAAHPHRYRALGFFLRWPRLDLAAKLVLDHVADWNGGYYEVLAPAAEALEQDHPLAAAVVYRALIDDILAKGRSQAYGHAARYLISLAILSAEGWASRGLLDHRAYVDTLKKGHGRKYGFWSLVDHETERRARSPASSIFRPR